MPNYSTVERYIESIKKHKDFFGSISTDQEKEIMDIFNKTKGTKNFIKFRNKVIQFLNYGVSDKFYWRCVEINKKPNSVTLENMKLKYGDIEGNRRWLEYCNKQAETNSFEYKSEKFGWSREQFEAYNKSRSCTLKNFIERHGEDVGMEKWNEYCERQRYTNTLEYFVDREGDRETGILAWEEYNRSKGNGQNIFYIMEKYNITFAEAEEKLTRMSCNFVSDMEKEFVEELEKKVGDIYFTHKTRQMCLWNKIVNRPAFYDVACAKRKKIIEFNGDYWHANPEVYESDEMVGKGELSLARDIWEYDAKKIQNARDRGYDILVIWENEWLADKNAVIDKCVNFWNG